MSIVLNLPADLESKLAAEASLHGVSLSDYVASILSNGGANKPSVHTGAELVAFWQSHGVVGTRADISDARQHARQLRAEAEQRP